MSVMHRRKGDRLEERKTMLGMDKVFPLLGGAWRWKAVRSGIRRGQFNRGKDVHPTVVHLKGR